MRDTLSRTLVVFVALLAFCLSAFAGGVSRRASNTSATATKSTSVNESPTVSRKLARKRHSRRSRRRYYERFTTSSFAEDQVAGDVIAGEDPVVRAAAVEALGNMNGAVLALDPNTGRILAMVNQKLALSEGAEPCSTIKLSVALAALREGIVTKDTMLRLSRRSRMNLTHALAVSNNNYFEALGRKLGFEKVSYYAHQFGLGELAGWNIDGEHLGVYPTEPIAAKLGGVGRMCSFGEGISMTPLQLGALVSAISNGGTLYYLQHPMSPEEMQNFHPVIKRQLDIAEFIPHITDGMAGAVQYGTARTVQYNFSQEEVLGWLEFISIQCHNRVLAPEWGAKLREVG